MRRHHRRWCAQPRVASDEELSVLEVIPLDNTSIDDRELGVGIAELRSKKHLNTTSCLCWAQVSRVIWVIGAISNFRRHESNSADLRTNVFLYGDSRRRLRSISRAKRCLILLGAVNSHLLRDVCTKPSRRAVEVIQSHRN